MTVDCNIKLTGKKKHEYHKQQSALLCPGHKNIVLLQLPVGKKK